MNFILCGVKGRLSTLRVGLAAGFTAYCVFALLMDLFYTGLCLFVLQGLVDQYRATPKNGIEGLNVRPYSCSGSCRSSGDFGWRIAETQSNLLCDLSRFFI